MIERYSPSSALFLCLTKVRGNEHRGILEAVVMGCCGPLYAIVKLDVLEFAHVVVETVQIGSVTAVVPPATTVSYSTVLILPVVIVL